ncbi:ABC transporter ATP-binding protein [Rhizobium mesoamericanum]|uniref:Fused maltose transport subunit, ATP-binding component of ABC superfamily regulatory protein n=1 Tax=Rhizobium mesoamericanum STM3625 TaxID=1211777 RepID=K0Q2B5_9HYPH|nr:sn-glycerol-3-phosphate ABC transporter ATP-binding protein UgpC [Rhizobium mesoamericanum]CCM78287.1 fused maltose transport subunit, ATP-binding component of ABC superfamily; regulatory protein [Rhizobium mesoamericanum STM3625]
MSQLSLRSIHKAFGTIDVIRGIDLDVAEGEFVVFVGPSGCGKSTMLRMISGLEDVTSGEINIAGKDVTRVAPAEREIAMVFQSYALFPHMTVAENIGFGLKLARRPRDEIKRKVEEVAAVLQIGQLLERTPRELSGGQRQRVAIGRAIIRQPRIFLFDEPLSNLDAALRVQMRLEIARLHQRLGATMIYVTHDQTEAMTLADRIIVFNKGHIEQVGAPMELYEWPANMFVAGFIGAPAMNFIPGRLDVAAGGQLLSIGSFGIALPYACDAQGDVTVGIRPEHLSLAPPSERGLSGRVELIEQLGAQTFAYIELEEPAMTVTVLVSPDVRLRTGDLVALTPVPEKVHVFDGSGRAAR